jgi:hypothetical protein
MSFNIGNALTGAIEGLVMGGGNPIAAGIGALTGGCASQGGAAQPANPLGSLLENALAETNGANGADPLRMLALEGSL